MSRPAELAEAHSSVSTSSTGLDKLRPAGDALTVKVVSVETIEDFQAANQRLTAAVLAARPTVTEDDTPIIRPGD